MSPPAGGCTTSAWHTPISLLVLARHGDALLFHDSAGHILRDLHGNNGFNLFRCHDRLDLFYNFVKFRLQSTVNRLGCRVGLSSP